MVADQLDQPMEFHLEAHNLAGVAAKADHLPPIYKIVVVLQPKHQEDHLLTAAQVVQLVHHGAVLVATVLHKLVEQIKAFQCVQQALAKVMQATDHQAAQA